MTCSFDESKMTSYSDNIKVKISEKYKPPPRINLAISYAQRLKLNKQIQDLVPNYNFSLETCVMEKMEEWRENKILFLKQRKSSLDLKRQKLEAKSDLAKKGEISYGTNSLSTRSHFATISGMSKILRNDLSDIKFKISNSSILTPTQASTSYSTILKPIQLQNYGKQLSNKEINKQSNFNLSDFENDTSSPFDNMELKSINDLEELAQVLNQEDKVQKLKTTIPLYTQNNPQIIYGDETQTSHLNYNEYLSGYSANQYLSNIPSIGTSVGLNDENLVYSNGSKYPTDCTQINQQYNPYTWTKLNSDYLPFQMADVDSKSNCKSVSDLVGALEIELDNSHISNLTYSKVPDKFNTNFQEIRPKSLNEVSIVQKKSCNEESLIKLLSKDEQDLCESISIMGFPIERVAKAYQLMGNDEKKIVEHLLAMSDLLDLGFHEKDVSSALLECDNDKDKALDKLIN